MAKKSGSLSSVVAKNGVLSKRKLRSESAADYFSDINDAEINQYLSNKTEMLFKTAMWKIMKKDYNPQVYESMQRFSLELRTTLHRTLETAPKKQRKPATEKKSSAKKAFSGTVEKVTGKEETKKRLSSKINYDALAKLTGELEEVTQKSKKGGIDSNSVEQIERQQSKGTSNSEKSKKGGIDSNSDEQIERQPSKETSNSKDSGFASEDDSYSDEFEPENANLYSYGNEEDDYGYREDYDEHEEF